ncbi:DUF2254 domain-containing protein [Streptomyces viridochromogenes]|uniref:DUF2254 domain-containing protein n=1 Tax=Streptomyces viridochromogenes Tue57 TaxID=1160705 RepID=L8P346_STRVR|nr:DUF2254 domain-containing protein [Streptomyces viridochromogenes]ELS50905.1 hypothetical protein STVIR_8128 [Streptomyces viridochromogenes Tue57]
MRDTLRVQLWPLPTLGITLAVVAGVGLPRLDGRIEHDMPFWLRDYLFGGSADAARSVLAAIAGSLVTVTALTFSLTVVTLQLASSQFSPRLLRTFTADRYVQTTLALFLTTFTFALTVLRTVRTGEEGQTGFVPRVSITMAFLLTLASLLALVLFLSHLARELRIETMMNSVHSAADRTIDRLLSEKRDATREGPAAGGPPAPPPEPPANAIPLAVRASGFLTSVDEAALLEATVEADALVLIDRLPGSSLVAGTPMGVAWPRTGEPFTSDTWARLAERISEAVRTGPERTDLQDVAFGLRQLTDIAAKALSPGINDPTTAVHALSYTSALLCELAHRDLGPRLLRDDHQRVRVVLRRPDLRDLLELAVAQPLRYGASEPAVLTRIAMLLRELAWCSAPDQHPAITAALARLRSTIDAQDLHATEHFRLIELTDVVEEALAGRWTHSRT